MTENQFRFYRNTVATNLKTPIVFNNETMSIGEVLDKLNELSDENERLKIFLKAVNEELDLANRDCDILEEENKQLKQYKQSVNDVLKSWSQKNLTAKQLQVVLAIMEELNVMSDVE